MTLITISEEKMSDLESQPNFEIAEEESGLLVRNITYYEYEELMRELEKVKDEVDKLKHEMASVVEEKTLAEKQIQVSSSKVMSYASSMRTLRSEIREVREEKTLKELARIEAMKEFEAVEARKEEELSQFSVSLESTKRKMNQILEEIDRGKWMEAELSKTTNDVDILQISLEMAKASEKSVRRSEHCRPSIKSGILSERAGPESESMRRSGSSSHEGKKLVSAKKELETIQGEAVQLMGSMDIIRNELVRVREETAKLKKAERKTETRIHNLNSKLLLANEKLETVSAAEEKAKAMVSNLNNDLVQVKTETGVSKKEMDLISEEIKKLEAVIQETDSEIELNGWRLENAIKELELVKSAESRALEELKDAIGRTMETRANLSRKSSSITISKFEYEYLKELAIGADVIADKKVAAAHAWIEALKSSEREILMKIEIENRRGNEVEEHKTVSKTKTGNPTTLRRVRHRKSISLAGRNMSRSSITIRRTKNGSTPSVMLYDNQSIHTDP